VPSPGAFAIGAGATIGTEADDGYTASAAIMFVLMLPGPVISLIGKANILSPRIGAASDDANFDAMATYDGNSQTFDLTIDAQYSIPVVLDITATAEIFVGEGQWYFALGKPPHEQRVSARIFDIFETDAYFVVSNTGLVTGTWTGYKNSWSFGPLSASVDAYLATLAAIQWSPLQIAGGIELYGQSPAQRLRYPCRVDRRRAAGRSAPNPFWVHGELSVELDLPWPLPNIGATISLTWGGDDGSVPPSPLALSRLNATLIDHCDSADKPASDHYVLLSHAAPAVAPDLTVTWDPVALGILGLTTSTGRTLTSLPDMIPDNSSTTPVCPGSAAGRALHPELLAGNLRQHGSLRRCAAVGQLPDAPGGARAASDLAGRRRRYVEHQPGSAAGAVRHPPYASRGCALHLRCGQQHLEPCLLDRNAHRQRPEIGVTQLSGVWLSAQTTNADPRQAMTQLKVVPWRLLPGVDETAQWSSESQIDVSGDSFTDQDLLFTVAAGIGNPDHRELRCRAVRFAVYHERQCSQSRRHHQLPATQRSHVDHRARLCR